MSVIVPTRDRPTALRRALTGLVNQDLEPSTYEIIVADDGSEPPVTVLDAHVPPTIRVLRLPHGERSTARNAGAAQATGRILAFVDDDMLPDRGMLRAHISAQRAWPGSLTTGAIRLPEQVLQTPFGRFREELEGRDHPGRGGPVARPNFCTASNMSISRECFSRLGGFSPLIRSAEDQDLALRHFASGGVIVYAPDAKAVHDDPNDDLRAYCLRSEWGAEHMAPFCARHPNWPDNRNRFDVNGPIRLGSDSPRRVLKKAAKQVLSLRAPLSVLYGVTDLVAARWPSSRLLPPLYRLAIGIHLQRGFRRGWASRSDEVNRTPP